MELNDKEEMQVVKTGGYKKIKPVISRCEMLVIFCKILYHYKCLINNISYYFK